MLMIQLGSALSAGLLIPDLGSAGTAWLRLSLGAIILILIARPPLRDIRRADVLPLLGLGIATEVDRAEALQPLQEMRGTVLLALTATALIALLLAALVVIAGGAVRSELERLVEAKTAELTKQERYLRTIIDNLPSVVVLKDLAGRYLMVNAYFERMTGLAVAAAIGRTDSEIMDPEAAAVAMECNVSGLVSNRLSSAASLLAVDASSRTTTAAPALSRARALASWCAAACGNGTRTEAVPVAVSSATVVAPARQTASFAAA